jgi:hypothetical protein
MSRSRGLSAAAVSVLDGVVGVASWVLTVMILGPLPA